MRPNYNIKQSECPVAIYEAHTMIMEYVKESLEKAGVQEYPTNEPYQNFFMTTVYHCKETKWYTM